MGKIVHKTGADEAKFHLRFKGVEVYYEYDSISDFINDWCDWSTFMNEEVYPLETKKSEARRQIDLFLKRTKHIPLDKSGYNNWKQNNDIYQARRHNG